MTLVYIGVFITALAFALVAIFSARLLLHTSTVISKLGETVDDIEKKLDKTVMEIENVISETEKTATDVETKLHAVNGLFVSILGVGQQTEIVSSKLQKRTKRYNKDGFLIGTKPFVSAIQISEFGLGLVKSWRNGQKASS